MYRATRILENKLLVSFSEAYASVGRSLINSLIGRSYGNSLFNEKIRVEAFSQLPKIHAHTGVNVFEEGLRPCLLSLSRVYGRQVEVKATIDSSRDSKTGKGTRSFSLLQQPLSKRELATVSAEAERYVGTLGGGMDQAIAFLGKQGSAMLIEFNPLRSSDITLPETAVFVIAHSQTCHNKASTNDYNLRVVECRFAALTIANKRNMPLEQVRRLSDVQDFLGASLEEMASIVTADFHEEPYTVDEICKNLGVTEDRLRSLSLGHFNVSQTFKLRQRALHVFQEAARVTEFRRVSQDSSMMEEEKLRRLGDLMCKSHESLQKLYECSHPSVDALVEKAMSYGALGARLTGAGWGGCIVAITTKDKVSEFVDKLKTESIRCGVKHGFQLDDLVFPTEPNQGAVIYAS